MPPVQIGTSGWSYDHWQGVLYPHGASSARRLQCYLERFHTVELNSSYYRWPSDKAFLSWQQRLPPDFLLTVKAPRWLTHYARLLHPEKWIERVTHSLALLQNRCGVFLVQLSPKMARDDARLEYFLDRMPRWIRIAVEFRHPSWHDEEVFRLLERYDAAYCVMSGARLPCILRATAHFVYVRLHGPDHDHIYAGSYSDDDLRWWADRVREWQGMGKEVFVYFNNDGGGNAVRNALTLRGLLGG